MSLRLQPDPLIVVVKGDRRASRVVLRWPILNRQLTRLSLGGVGVTPWMVSVSSSMREPPRRGSSKRRRPASKRTSAPSAKWCRDPDWR
jgi:hypothetical protein